MEPPRGRQVRLPLLPDTAGCLACPWTATGPNVQAAAKTHGQTTRHPTIAPPREPSRNGANH
jgi:hypothetical protein